MFIASYNIKWRQMVKMETVISSEMLAMMYWRGVDHNPEENMNLQYSKHLKYHNYHAQLSSNT
jgi:hypothetical protein